MRNLPTHPVPASLPGKAAILLPLLYCHPLPSTTRSTSISTRSRFAALSRLVGSPSTLKST
ncbi:zinc finger protein 692 (predicted), isoform CRA_d [Rattus norvegicus]|uniref:Zinc finger protein 692 (Predicted), isoform CRA_d n=1 Tax=Rattus norvegicus TaxID=10116 RepID=A6HES8_RAT|nr:zinc finger protein 692 (predicted), isoform CRA_d [Rattus norvegicus]